MRRVAEDFSDSFLSHKIETRGLSANALTGFPHGLGTRRDKITEFMRGYIDPDDNIIFDGTDELSASRCMDYLQLTKTKKGAFDTAVNIMWIFNCAKHLPVYYRLMPGSIKDVSAFKVCVEDSGMRNGVAIIEKARRLRGASADGPGGAALQIQCRKPTAASRLQSSAEFAAGMWGTAPALRRNRRG